VKEFLAGLKGNLSGLGLQLEAEKELKAEIVTIETQIDSPKPKLFIIGECLKSFQRILESVAGTVIANQLLTGLAPLIH